MKKYTYYFKDLELNIEADSGREAEIEFKRVTGKTTPDYDGRIELTNNITGYTNELLPIEFN